jgi:hypothetical protein
MIHCTRKTAIANVFSIYWKTESGELITDSSITIDFNPILNRLNSNGTGIVLVHYQAKPKYLRRYGVFYSGDYYTTNEDIVGYVPFIAVCLDERELILPPNAVFAFPNCFYNPNSNSILPLPS